MQQAFQEQSNFDTPAKGSQQPPKFTAQVSCFDSPPANTRVLKAQSPDESLEYLRRAPRKGDRPQYLQYLHEEAASECSRKLFSFNDSSDECSTNSGSSSHLSTPKPFSLEMPYSEGSIGVPQQSD